MQIGRVVFEWGEGCRPFRGVLGSRDGLRGQARGRWWWDRLAGLNTGDEGLEDGILR